jgi:hypothetical protein
MAKLKVDFHHDDEKCQKVFDDINKKCYKIVSDWFRTEQAVSKIKDGLIIDIDKLLEKSTNEERYEQIEMIKEAVSSNGGKIISEVDHSNNCDEALEKKSRESDKEDKKYEFRVDFQTEEEKRECIDKLRNIGIDNRDYSNEFGQTIRYSAAEKDFEEVKTIFSLLNGKQDDSDWENKYIREKIWEDKAEERSKRCEKEFSRNLNDPDEETYISNSSTGSGSSNDDSESSFLSTICLVFLIGAAVLFWPLIIFLPGSGIASFTSVILGWLLFQIIIGVIYYLSSRN